MKRFNNILLLYECDGATLARAATLAKNNRARLTVIQIVRDMPEQLRQMSLGGEPVDLQTREPGDIQPARHIRPI